MPRPTLSRIPERTPLYKEDVNAQGRFDKTLTQDWRTFLQRVDAPRYQQAVFPISDTAVANNVGYPVPVLLGGPAVDLAVVLKLSMAGGMELVFRRNTARIGSMWIPANTTAYQVISQDTFEAKNLQFAAGDVLTIDITQSDGTADPGGVAVAYLRWISE